MRAVAALLLLGSSQLGDAGRLRSPAHGEDRRIYRDVSHLLWKEETARRELAVERDEALTALHASSAAGKAADVEVHDLRKQLKAQGNLLEKMEERIASLQRGQPVHQAKEISHAQEAKVAAAAMNFTKRLYKTLKETQKVLIVKNREIKRQRARLAALEEQDRADHKAMQAVNRQYLNLKAEMSSQQGSEQDFQRLLQQVAVLSATVQGKDISEARPIFSQEIAEGALRDAIKAFQALKQHNGKEANKTVELEKMAASAMSLTKRLHESLQESQKALLAKNKEIQADRARLLALEAQGRADKAAMEAVKKQFVNLRGQMQTQDDSVKDFQHLLQQVAVLHAAMEGKDISQVEPITTQADAENMLSSAAKAFQVLKQFSTQELAKTHEAEKALVVAKSESGELQNELNSAQNQNKDYESKLAGAATTAEAESQELKALQERLESSDKELLARKDTITKQQEELKLASTRASTAESSLAAAKSQTAQFAQEAKEAHALANTTQKQLAALKAQVSEQAKDLKEAQSAVSRSSMELTGKLAAEDKELKAALKRAKIAEQKLNESQANMSSQAEDLLGMQEKLNETIVSMAEMKQLNEKQVLEQKAEFEKKEQAIKDQADSQKLAQEAATRQAVEAVSKDSKQQAEDAIQARNQAIDKLRDEEVRLNREVQTAKDDAAKAAKEQALEWQQAVKNARAEGEKQGREEAQKAAAKLAATLDEKSKEVKAAKEAAEDAVVTTEAQDVEDLRRARQKIAERAKEYAQASQELAMQDGEEVQDTALKGLNAAINATNTELKKGQAPPISGLQIPDEGKYYDTPDAALAAALGKAELPPNPDVVDLDVAPLQEESNQD